MNSPQTKDTKTPSNAVARNAKQRIQDQNNNAHWMRLLAVGNERGAGIDRVAVLSAN